MEKRLLVAVLLMTAVILMTNVLFPPPPPEDREEVTDVVGPEAPPTPGEPPELEADPGPPVAPRPDPAVEPGLAEDTVEVVSPRYRYRFASRGAALVAAELPQHRSFVREGPVQLVPEGGRFLAHRLVIGQDTIDLRHLAFRPESERLEVPEDGPAELRFVHGEEGGFRVEVVYTFHPDEYVIGVRGEVGGLGEVGFALLTDLGPGLEPHDVDLSRTIGEMALVTRGSGGGIETTRLDRIGPNHVVNGPLRWAGVKDRYFLAAVIVDEGPGLGGVVARELPGATLVRTDDGGTETHVVPRADVVATLSVGPSGRFGFRAFLGPQEYGHLAAVGSDLQQVNPYGYRWLQPIIRPIAAVILWTLDVLHDNLGIAYGWVLIIFGIIMRVVLWPLNAKAMRAQLRNMGVQPLIQELRDKYKDDPKRQQQEMMKLYKEHGFNPLAGCLPMLIPFPVLITLFFVFEGTVAFRGESFLWLPDLSLRDPLFLLPLFLVVSMFSLQLINVRLGRMEVNPQMKFMMYGMPLMVGIIFFFLPSGLNLYYATTNVATIPQTILIAGERRKAQEEMEAKRAAADDPGERKAKKTPQAAGANRAARRRAARKR